MSGAEMQSDASSSSPTLWNASSSFAPEQHQAEIQKLPFGYGIYFKSAKAGCSANADTDCSVTTDGLDGA